MIVLLYLKSVQNNTLMTSELLFSILHSALVNSSIPNNWIPQKKTSPFLFTSAHIELVVDK